MYNATKLIRSKKPNIKTRLKQTAKFKISFPHT